LCSECLTMAKAMTGKMAAAPSVIGGRWRLSNTPSKEPKRASANQANSTVTVTVLARSARGDVMMWVMGFSFAKFYGRKIGRRAAIKLSRARIIVRPGSGTTDEPVDEAACTSGGVTPSITELIQSMLEEMREA